MIKIKDYIFNENDINNIHEIRDDLRLNLKNCSSYVYIPAKIEDIEWNYGTPQETQRQMQKELCKSCYYRDTISNKLEELEEENKKLKDELEKRKRINGEIPKVIEDAGLDYYNEKFKKRIIKLEDKIKELEEENKRLNFCMKDTYDSANDICSELQQRIDKAIKYLKLKVDIPKNHLEEAIKDREEDLLKILGEEEND